MENQEEQRFSEDLQTHGLIIPSGVPGVFGRGALFEEVLERFDAFLREAAAVDQPEVYTFPPVLSRRILERLSYLDTFPHLCGAICSFVGDEREAKLVSERVHRQQPWNDLLSQTDVVMNPAACYPVYPMFAGTVGEGGRTVTFLAWVFRHEPSPEPTRMQSFRVRELVKVGTPREALEWRDRWLDRGLALLKSLGLSVSADVASDPFFGRGGEFLTTTQMEQRLKFEVRTPIISNERPTAICSFNYHLEHFAAPFEIRTSDGSVANTACVGFGLERVVMALFKAHGFSVETWPYEVRRRLWPSGVPASRPGCRPDPRH